MLGVSMCALAHVCEREREKKGENIEGLKKDGHREEALNIFHGLDPRLLFL